MSFTVPDASFPPVSNSQLPLSFMASFFALAIDKFPKGEDGNTRWPLSYICGLICKFYYKCKLEDSVRQIILTVVYIVGISFAVSIPFILFALALELLKNGWSQFRHFWVKMLILLPLHLLSRLPSVLGSLGDNWWDTVADSANSHDKFSEDRLRQLVHGDDEEFRVLDDDIMHLFGKRIRRFMEAGRLGASPEDSDNSDDLAESEDK